MHFFFITITFPKIEESHFQLRRFFLPRAMSINRYHPFPVLSVVGPSMAVPFPRKTLRYSKSGNSLFMAGSENLERYWKRPRRESKRWSVRERDRERGIKRKRVEGVETGAGSEKARATKEEERYWSDGSVPSGKREERRLVPDPIKRKRNPPAASPPPLSYVHVTASSPIKFK